MKKFFQLTALAILLLVACSTHREGLRSYHMAMLQEADVLFIQEDFHGAVAIYDQILEVNPAHALSNLRAGICRLNMRNHQTEALKFLERAKEQKMVESTYYIGLALHFQERFEDALTAMNGYLTSGDDAIPEPTVRRQIEMIERARLAYGRPLNYQLTNLGSSVNSPYPDYVPLVTADGSLLYFTSRRPGGFSDQHDPNGDFYEDIYVCIRSGQNWQQAQNLSAPVNTESHDATVAISPSGNQLLTYRTNADLDGGDIYHSEMTAEGWSKPEKFTDRVNSRFFEPSAAIALDERTIYFASNRPGGYGGKDIYRVVQLPDGQWSYPVNLGPEINTPGHEDGPFISADGQTLYFASTEHNGIGGYDIFRSSWNTEKAEWQTPESLGYPVNTVFDDIYLVVEADGKTGYYSTNRAGGFGDHDIYRVEFGVENPIVLLTGTITDETGQVVRADIHAAPENGGESAKYQSNAKSGKYVLVLEPGQLYNVSFSGMDLETLQAQLEYEEELGSSVRKVSRDFVLKHLNQQSSNE